MKSLRRNLGLKIASLFIAVLLWVYVMSVSYSPPRKQVFNLDFSTLDTTQYAIVDPPRPQQISVDVTGNQDALRNLSNYKADNFIASVDLTNAHAGTAAYPVTLHFPSEPGLQFAKPPAVTLHIEDKIEVSKPVSVRYVPSIPDGYTALKPEVTPSSVMVDGPESYVQKVTQVVVYVDLTNYKPGQVFTGSVELLDPSDNAVSGVFSDPSKVNVQPVLMEAKNIKDVPIDLNWSGNLGNYELASAPKTEPQEIEITGQPDALKDVTMAQTKPIDLSEVTHDSVVRVPLAPFPPGVKSKTKSVRVSIRVVRKPSAPPIVTPATQAAPNPTTASPQAH